MGKKKRRKGTSPAEAAEPFNNPFGSLGGVRSATVPKTVSDAKPAVPSPYAGKLVIRRERKGHGGKTVTILHGVNMPADALAELARELGKAFGGSARVDDVNIVISGDHCTRLAKWLQDNDAKMVVVGN